MIITYYFYSRSLKLKVQGHLLYKWAFYYFPYKFQVGLLGDLFLILFINAACTPENEMARYVKVWKLFVFCLKDLWQHSPLEAENPLQLWNLAGRP
jgi:hypothetical protein